MLLIVKEKGTSQISIAVCNPNLNPITDREFGWRSTPTYASIVLEGKWKNTRNNNNIKEENIDGNTKISFTLQEGGEPLYFDLNK